MPKITPSPEEQTSGTLADSVEKLLANVVITTKPVIICGANRKVNIGNFENIDVYMALAYPIDCPPGEDIETLVAAAAERGFSIVSQEVGNRYNMIKETQRSAGR